MSHKKPDSERFEALEMSEKMGRSPRHKAVMMGRKRKKDEKKENHGKKGRY